MNFANKPWLLEKLLEYNRYVQKNQSIGIKPRGLVINPSNACNFECKHCFTRSAMNAEIQERLTVDVIERVADEADALGIYEIDIQGGEPLLLPNLTDIINAFGSDRFYIYVTTNGFLLGNQEAEELAESVGALVERILKLVLRDKDDADKDDSD